METLKNSKRTKNPYEGMNWLSKFSLWHINGTYSTANKRNLDSVDIFEITKDQETKNLADKLEKEWQKEIHRKKRKNQKPSFFWTIVRMAGLRVPFVGFIFLLMESLRITQSICLRNLLHTLSTKGVRESNEAYYWVTGITTCLFVTWALLHPAFLTIEKLGLSLKSAAVALIYKKALRLNSASLGSISTGHVVTLISSDAHKVQEGFKLANYIWVGPFQLIAVIVILWRELGPSSIAGVGVLLLVVPIQASLGKFFAYMRLKTVLKTDKRVNIMNEVISSIHVTKMYTWENSFSSVINVLRNAESSKIMKTAMVRAINSSMFTLTPYLVSLATFTMLYYHGDGLSLESVFFTMSLFFSIRLGVAYFFPLSIQMMMEFYVACKRIEKFLLQEEIQSIKNEDTDEVKDDSESCVLFDKVTAAWIKTTEDAAYKNLSFKADKNNPLVMIFGSVGAGKSSILMTVMKELQIIEGNLRVNGTIAYSAQQPWIFSGTIRSNILFGRKYDKSRYEEIITACALKPDIEAFDKGDLTLVGEKGITLSGGQKARISLARAVYHDADIYLLDDPLSAVDTKVGKHIFEKCIRGMLRKKIVILVTHQTQYAHHATDIICLKENAKMVEGSLHEISQQGVDLDTLIHQETHLKEADENHNTETEKEYHCVRSEDNRGYEFDGDTLHIPSEKMKPRSTSLLSLDLDESGIFSGFRESIRSKISTEAMKNNINVLEEDVEEEKVMKGNVPLKLYKDYLLMNGGGCAALCFLLALMIVGQASLTFTDYWLAEWSVGEKEKRDGRNITSKFYIKDDPDYNLYVFAGLAFVGIIINLARTMYFFRFMIKCSRNLHSEMFQAILKAPIHFFDTNPVGQILNRFSRDIYFMDDELPWIFYDFVQLTALTLAIVIMNCISVPYITIIVAPALIVFVYARQYYIKTSRQVKRLEAISRSPLYTHVSATLAGLTTIRSFGLEKKVIDEFYACQNYQAEAWLMFLTCARWFGQRIDLFSIIFAVICLYAPVITLEYTDIDPGLIGVSLTYILLLCGMFQWSVRQSAETDNLMTSVERVYEYSQLEGEKDDGTDKGLRPTWPEAGAITAKAASFAYHHTLPNVLKNLDFTIKSMEKIGIVGRTGAGKSSLVSMLFRLGHSSGDIFIDGVFILDLKLRHLRECISVIPQDPVLFSGTLRHNLDPFLEFKDADIWAALEEVQMKERVLEFSQKLETEITESGSNCSVGEKQLLCLARALLKKNKILVIDEATANVDLETDEMIQKTLRNKFKQCTVLTIAHRLNTIMDSDRVMVLNDGHLVEFDEPHLLLQNETGYFRKLVDQVGQNEAKHLEILAEAAKQIRHEILLQETKTVPGIVLNKEDDGEILIEDTRC